MVSRSFGCNPNRLRRLLSDDLPEEGDAEAAKHVEVCRHCRQRLESLAAEAGWWSQAREFLGREVSEEPPAGRPQQGTPDSTGAAKGGETASQEGNAPLPGLLAPSDDPDKLGRLGPYEIVEVIGSGGMGIVLKGFDAPLNRYVAIKVLSPPLASSGPARRRFAREAQAAAAVVHEHVVPIHSVDSAGGLPYLVMPFVQGESLAERIDRTGPLALEEILRIGMQVASGLAAAHAQGLVHRDCKPANVLLENGVERVMITDFGLARAADDASLTQSGVLAGTPQYMAPEQAKGETIDHRADLFSLGSVLYAMGTGRSPFRAETTMGVLRRICESTPRPIREVNPEIPDWLAEIIEKLHAKDPADRFQTAAEVAGLLGRHLAHLQHPAAAPMPERLKGRTNWRRAVRRLTRPLAIVALVLLLIGGLAVTEALKITSIWNAEVDRVQEGRREEVGQSAASTDAQGSPAESDAAKPAFKVIPSDLLQWDDGLEDPIDQLGQRIRQVQEHREEPSQEDPSLDAASAIDLQLRELEQDLKTSLP